MKMLSLKSNLGRARTIIFDLDSTLYTNPEYASWQEYVLVKRLAKFLKKDYEVLKEEIFLTRNNMSKNNLAKKSLGQIFEDYGVSFSINVQWKSEEILPQAWLSTDLKLKASLEELRNRYKLLILSNNPKIIVEKSLHCLGVRECFENIFGLEDSPKGKPDLAAFINVVKTSKLKSEDCISIGDRVDIDLKPALELGMAAILIESVNDVYELPNFLP